ncbi:MAG: hypothetical protein IPI59_11700 [Sphingobacteriales bacterium]|nr:hypothetical protein [Sphingobacteriales bacterium]MBK6889309.1 hypothetical protein [Sphingobacteriales bacterium]MBK7528194.1 hypothetical protein [Sphingobacteriales bacterium]MBK8679825.1 hypothetical protein [Sphingobacteriales bacterium]MBL0246079.1 hypothetical protein [Sphingobacteriales bacterium]
MRKFFFLFGLIWLLNLLTNVFAFKNNAQTTFLANNNNNWTSPVDNSPTTYIVNGKIEAAIQQAKIENKLLFIYIQGEGCAPCRELSRTLLLSELASIYSNNFIVVALDQFHLDAIEIMLNSTHSIKLPFLMYKDPNKNTTLYIDESGDRSSKKLVDNANYVLSLVGKTLNTNSNQIATPTINFSDIQLSTLHYLHLPDDLFQNNNSNLLASNTNNIYVENPNQFPLTNATNKQFPNIKQQQQKAVTTINTESPIAIVERLTSPSNAIRDNSITKQPTVSPVSNVNNQTNATSFENLRQLYKSGKLNQEQKLTYIHLLEKNNYDASSVINDNFTYLLQTTPNPEYSPQVQNFALKYAAYPKTITVEFLIQHSNILANQYDNDQLTTIIQNALLSHTYEAGSYNNQILMKQVREWADMANWNYASPFRKQLETYFLQLSGNM